MSINKFKSATFKVSKVSLKKRAETEKVVKKEQKPKKKRRSFTPK